MSTLKYSRQREAIKTFLMNRTDHPTADTVYTSLRQTYPNISLGTVYRNLSLLEQIGEISKISTGSGADHYDANMTQHQHFICTSCHRVYDIQIKNIDSIMDAAADSAPGVIESYRANFYGKCKECQENELS
ncbi:MAG: transcriptional repressor [Lachnospiraceae bacterium]|nr:transcriptional repressor [Lachnospiraceae bacterium]